MTTLGNKKREKIAQSRGWRLEYIEGNGIDDYLWVSPDGMCYGDLPAMAYIEIEKPRKKMKVGNTEKREVSELNNELFNAAKSIMEDNGNGPYRARCPHIGWAVVGDFIDWLEENYEIKKK